MYAGFCAAYFDFIFLHNGNRELEMRGVLMFRKAV
jgi:hypothetical protein